MTGHSKGRPRRRWLAIAIVVALTLVLVPTVWLGMRSRQVVNDASTLTATAAQLRADATALDLAGVARDITTLHDQAAALHESTSGPLWGAATVLPVVGARAAAVRQLASVADSLATAAAPLAELLPRFDVAAIRASGGRLDLPAVTALAPVLTDLAAAADRAAADLGDIDTGALTATQADEVTRLRASLTEAAPLLHSAASTIPLIVPLLGGDGPRTWFVALENLSEARGTGGFVGAYAVMRADAGKVSLVQAGPDTDLVSGPRIPDGNLPTEFRQLWGVDATEWNGLNLSPHFPYTGQLVIDGWKARGGVPLDGVVAIDQTVVAALLAGTGPVTVHGVTVDSAHAFAFLTQGIYARFPSVAEKNAVVVDLVKAVFQRLSTGQVSFAALVTALRGPLSEGRFLVYSANTAEEAKLADLVVAGVLPDAPGPFAMVAVNNGSGDKLNAYTSVHLDYRQGTCTAAVRDSTIHITVHNGAPASGLPAYVVGNRSDLPVDQRANAPAGSTKVLLYVYGPVDSANALTTVDGKAVDVSEGLERGHPVWRVDVVLNPGQTGIVDIQVIENVDPTASTTPTVGVQPMAIPQVVSAEAGPACTPS